MPRAKRRGRPPFACTRTRLPFHLWAEKYREGQALVTTDIEQVSPHCWPAGLKCRSRMHYYLADKRAAAMDPQARALLLDAQGFVTEASTANLLIYNAGRGLASPPSAKILRGISLAVVVELARAVRHPVCRARSDRRRRGLGRRGAVDQHADVPAAGHTFQRPADRHGAAGKVFHRLIAAWSEMVGVDIVGQAERFAREENEGMYD